MQPLLELASMRQNSFRSMKGKILHLLNYRWGHCAERLAPAGGGVMPDDLP